MPRDVSSCVVCGETADDAELIREEMVRPALSELIGADRPEWGPGRSICRPDLDRYRSRYVEKLLAEERGELTRLEEDVVRVIREQALVTADVNTQFDRALTFGERMADQVARFGGSWAFLGCFALFLGLWVLANSLALLRRPFDPYPFILLNLILSCVAAMQAPIIMMSQNRQEAKDRLRAENDYRVNLKAELEIRLLTERIDHLLKQQWQRLLEIQEIQVELMEELGRRRPRGREEG
jgi:uncharacterized membrane protein